jgi:transcriptional/translational regulatory protein YebC/TACO1
MNFALRIAIDKAKAVNMPSDNIERSIKKGIGGDDKTQFQKISYEAIKGNGASLIIDCQTDNTNRTVSELKKIWKWVELNWLLLVALPGSLKSRVQYFKAC